MGRIYLDHNASTPIASSVVQAMAPFLEAHYGNPSTTHWAARPAAEALIEARAQVAELLGAEPSEVVFTSGGSESNNHAIKGVLFRELQAGRRAPHIICSAIEHPSVLQVCAFAERMGARLSRVPVDGHGRVDPAEVRAALRADTALISVMHANNEVGTLQPIAELSTIARQAGVLLHSDAAQSLGKVPIQVDQLGVDLLSLAGHKLYAPKGIGALYVRGGVQLEPLLHGASHEHGRRAGTENVMLAVGLGAACELGRHDSRSEQQQRLRDAFQGRLEQAFGDRVMFNGHPRHRLPNTLNVSFVGHLGPELLSRLEGVAASTGSACHAGSRELSPVLAAMGVAEQRALGAIRFSLGRSTTQQELDDVLTMLEAVV